MGQANVRKKGSIKRQRFIYLMRLISKYADWEIIKFADNRRL
jgi:hypothetical protein